MNYALNEVFATIQGEGHHTGKASVFVRLQGCDVGCPWCDTKETWSLDAAEREAVGTLLLAGPKSDPRWCMISDFDLASHIAEEWAAIHHVVITGGEPATFDLLPLCAALVLRGNSVQIETSGTEPLTVPPEVWVTVSPKMSMPGGKVLNAETLMRADEIKMVVGKPLDVEMALFYRDNYRPKSMRIQPLSQSKKATDICIEAAIRHGLDMSIQTHKYLEVA